MDTSDSKEPAYGDPYVPEELKHLLAPIKQRSDSCDRHKEWIYRRPQHPLLHLTARGRKRNRSGPRRFLETKTGPPLENKRFNQLPESEYRFDKISKYTLELR